MSVCKQAVAVWTGVVLLTSTAPAAADTASTAAPTRWGCDISEQHLVCFVERSAPAPAAPLLPPLDERLPLIVRELRHRPGLWRGRTVRIPLYTEPLPDSPLQQLVQAVLCGAASGCEAVIGLPRWSSPTAWLDFADAHDPLLQPRD